MLPKGSETSNNIEINYTNIQLEEPLAKRFGKIFTNNK